MAKNVSQNTLHSHNCEELTFETFGLCCTIRCICCIINLVIFRVGVDIFDHHLAEVHCSEEQSPLLYSAVRERQQKRGGEGGQATIIYRGKHFAQNFPLKADKLGSFQAKGEKIICSTATTCRQKMTLPKKMTQSVKK